MCLTIELSLGEVYPFPPIRGQRITRLEEADLGPFQLDGETAERLAEDNIGVFVGGCRDLDWMMERLAILAETDFPARWLVILASKGLAEIVYDTLAREHGWRRRMHVPRFWNHGPLTFTTPEGLSSYRRTIQASDSFAAVMLVDPLCHVHQARNLFVPGYGVNDRPQWIADFRADLGRTGPMPPFFILTERLPKSIGTDRMLSAYCLDAWWFVDARRLRIGQPPVTRSQSPTPSTSLRLAI